MQTIHKRLTFVRLSAWLAVAVLLLGAAPAWAGVVTLVGTGSGALVHNGTTKIDIVDPDGDNVIDTAEWGTAPTILNSTRPVGTFNAPNNGENWSKLFDNAVNSGSTWGSGTSKVCCEFSPGLTSFTVTSATDQYYLTGYTLANGNDSSGRRPTAWRLYGSNDGFATAGDLLDTVAVGDVSWTANNQVGEVVLPGPTAGYSSFRIVFDHTVAEPTFQLAEVELIGASTTFEVGGDGVIGSYNPDADTLNAVGGVRFVRVSERHEAGLTTRFHISEIEAFGVGVVPDETGQASYDGPNLSGNDMVPSGYHVATTTSSIQHGNPTSVYDGNHETSASVWSTNAGLSLPDPRYTLDLGVAGELGMVRVYPRNEACCTDHRFASVTIEALGDDGTGNPGAVLGTYYGPDYVPGDPFATAALEAVFNIPYDSADLVGSLVPAVTYVFELNGPAGTMDLIEVNNPFPANYTTYLDLNSATAVIQLTGGGAGVGTFQMLSADFILGQFSEIILPETEAFTFDTSRLYSEGILVVTPEPATLSLLGLGLLAVRRRRRR